MATFARYRFVPIPTVAVIPVSLSTSRIIVIAMAWAGSMPDLSASSRYMCRYPLQSIKHSSIEYTCTSSGATYRR